MPDATTQEPDATRQEPDSPTRSVILAVTISVVIVLVLIVLVAVIVVVVVVWTKKIQTKSYNIPLTTFKETMSTKS